MAVSDIKANTKMIIAAGDTIRSNSAKYAKLYQGMYDEINNLRASWTSQDGNAYIAKINSYKDRFEKLNAALNKSAESLQADAKNYESALTANLNSI